MHAHVQSPHAYDAADAAGVLVFQDFPLQWFYDCGHRDQPRLRRHAQRQIAEMAYLLHAHPSVVYYACHNEPRRMFIPTPPDDDTPERDLGERHLDAALPATLRASTIRVTCTRRPGIGDDVHDYHGSLTGGDLYRVGKRRRGSCPSTASGPSDHRRRSSATRAGRRTTPRCANG